MFLKIVFLVLAIAAFSQEDDNYIDFDEILEENKIVIATKQIVFDEYPGAHNPSIIQFGDNFLLTFRYVPDMYRQPWTSYIGVVLLNHDFEAITEPQLLNTRSRMSKTPSQSEDARVFSSWGRFFVIYNDNIDVCCPSYGDRRDMFIAELCSDQGVFTLSQPTKLIHYQKYRSSLWQKNWVPFEWNNRLLITYSVSPHEIIYPNFLTGECYMCYETEFLHEWDFGTLRCSAPPLLVDGEYLSFFHSGKVIASEASYGHEIWHYFMGAYTFAPDPPFAITSYTKKPIVGEGFYTGGSYYKRVIFPGGFVVSNSAIYLAYGKDDSEIWIATIDKEALKKALVVFNK